MNISNSSVYSIVEFHSLCAIQMNKMRNNIVIIKYEQFIIKECLM